MVDDGFYVDIARQMDQNKSMDSNAELNLESWLPELFKQGIVLVINRTGLEVIWNEQEGTNVPVDDRKLAEAFACDLQAVLDNIEEHKETAAVFEDSSQFLGAICFIRKTYTAADAKCMASNIPTLLASLKLLESKAYDKWWQDCAKVAMIQSAWASARATAQKCMSDKLGLEKMDNGNKPFDWDQVPRLKPWGQPYEGYFFVLNFHSIESMSIADVLQESLDSVMEGIGMLSDIGRHEMRTRFEEW